MRDDQARRPFCRRGHACRPDGLSLVRGAHPCEADSDRLEAGWHAVVAIVQVRQCVTAATLVARLDTPLRPGYWGASGFNRA